MNDYYYYNYTGLPPPCVMALASLCSNPSIARPLLTAVSGNNY